MRPTSKQNAGHVPQSERVFLSPSGLCLDIPPTWDLTFLLLSGDLGRSSRSLVAVRIGQVSPGIDWLSWKVCQSFSLSQQKVSPPQWERELSLYTRARKPSGLKQFALGSLPWPALVLYTRTWFNRPLMKKRITKICKGKLELKQRRKPTVGCLIIFFDFVIWFEPASSEIKINKNTKRWLVLQHWMCA